MDSKRVPEDAPEDAEAVGPFDFLSLRVISSAVADADLIDGAAELGNFRGEFGFDAEAILLDADALEHVGAEHFVARLHIGEVEIREHIDQQREKFIADRMPEIQHAVLIADAEARTIDYLSAAIDDRFDQFVVFLRVVFKVGVLDDDNVAGNSSEAGAKRRTFA